MLKQSRMRLHGSLNLGETRLTKNSIEKPFELWSPLKDMFSPGEGLISVWEAGPYIISHRDKQDTPSDQNSQSSLTALMSPYG